MCVLVQDAAGDVQSIDSCEFIWEAGVGFAQAPPLNHTHDSNRSESKLHPIHTSQILPALLPNLHTVISDL